MPTKSKSTKRRTKVREISKGSKPLSKAEQKKVKGGGVPRVLSASSIPVRIVGEPGSNGVSVDLSNPNKT